MERIIRKNTILLIVFVFLCGCELLFCDEVGIASKDSPEAKQKRRCPGSLKKLWQIDVSSFPFASAPLVVDADGDGGLDVVAAPFGESLTIIEGETGKTLHDTGWPRENLDKSVHSSPLQFDIDGDSVLDFLFVTSQGEGLFYTAIGYTITEFTFQLSPAYVKAEWFKEVGDADFHTVAKYVSAEPTSSKEVPIDAHVLATPVLHNHRQLIIPVSYFFSEEDYSDENVPWGSAGARTKYFVTGIVTLDLLQLRSSRMVQTESGAPSPFRVRFFELKQSPTYILFSPTVVDCDGKFGPAEVIFGTSSGNVFIFSAESGKQRDGFPLQLGPLAGRISVVNLDLDQDLELIVPDSNGKVSTVSANSGKVKWSAEVVGTSFAGSRIVDVDMDGQMDVLIATDKGYVYALNGLNGSVLHHYPFKAGKRIAGNILITKFNAIRPHVDLVFLSDNGYLHILASDHSCHSQIPLEDTSLVDLTLQDLVLMNRGMEILVATSDGSLICFGSGQEPSIEELVEDEYRLQKHRLACPSDLTSHNDFMFSFKTKPVIFIEERTRTLREVTGSSFFLYFSIHDTDRTQVFNLQVFIGSDMVYQAGQITTASAPEWIEVQTPEQPGQGQVTIAIFDRHGFVSTDSVSLKFNQLILLDLQWLVLAPFIGMVIILLVNHGFPAKDLLPITFPFKKK